MINSNMRDEATVILTHTYVQKGFLFQNHLAVECLIRELGFHPSVFPHNIFVRIDNIDILVEGRSPVDSCIASTARATRGWSHCALEAAVDASCL